MYVQSEVRLEAQVGRDTVGVGFCCRAEAPRATLTLHRPTLRAQALHFAFCKSITHLVCRRRKDVTVSARHGVTLAVSQQPSKHTTWSHQMTRTSSTQCNIVQLRAGFITLGGFVNGG
jgi:hypothetical protein